METDIFEKESVDFIEKTKRLIWNLKNYGSLPNDLSAYLNSLSLDKIINDTCGIIEANSDDKIGVIKNLCGFWLRVSIFSNYSPDLDKLNSLAINNNTTFIDLTNELKNTVLNEDEKIFPFVVNLNNNYYYSSSKVSIINDYESFLKAIAETLPF